MPRPKEARESPTGTRHLTSSESVGSGSLPMSGLTLRTYAKNPDRDGEDEGAAVFIATSDSMWARPSGPG